MAETIIKAEHRPPLARQQHVLEWLQAEAQRLQAELMQVMAQGQREQQKLQAFLQVNYSIAGQGWTLDAERGVIVTPDEEQAEPEDGTAG